MSTYSHEVRVTPPARSDAVPWTLLHIEEAAVTPEGPGTFTEIEIKAFPVDTTPSSADQVTVTFTTATLASGYYRFRFEDAAGILSEYTNTILDPAAATGLAYFTIDELRIRYPELTDANYPDPLVDEYRQLAEEAFEDAARRAFVPRATTEPAGQGSPYGGRRLLRRDIRRVLAATDDAGTTIDIAGARIRNGWVDGLPAGRISVTYEYGLDAPPRRVKQAVMVLTRQWLLKGPIDDRQTQLPTESGGAINLATPGLLGSTFGLPEVDACVRLYGARDSALT